MNVCEKKTGRKEIGYDMVYPPEAIIAFHSFVLCFCIMKLNTELHFELCMFNQKTKSLRYEMNFLVRYSIQVCKSYYSII